jgi:cytochrome c-type biogenesis protein CcmH/NrfF
MFKWSNSAALAVALVIAGVAQAQMSSRNQKVDALRVGSRLACQCGCADTVATCSMLGCGFSHPAKEKIAQMQDAGASDSAIIDDFIKTYGQGIYRGAPNAFGWLVPYAILALGAVVVIGFVRRSRRPRPALVMDPRLARYNDQIEQELHNLDR